MDFFGVSEVEPDVFPRDVQGSRRTIARYNVGAVGMQTDREQAVIWAIERATHGI